MNKQHVKRARDSLAIPSVSASGSSDGRVDEEPPGEDTNLGVSFVWAAKLDSDPKWVYCSPSIYDILGYEPHELMGTRLFDLMHPEETPQLVGIQSMYGKEESMAIVAYHRIRHKSGEYLDICTAFSYVSDSVVATCSRVTDRSPLRNPFGARDVLEVTKVTKGDVKLRKWKPPAKKTTVAPSSTASPASSFGAGSSRSSSASPSYTSSPPTSTTTVTDLSVPPALQDFDPADYYNLAPVSQRRKRTFFLLDRFTETAKIMWASNDVIVNTHQVTDKPFYSIVRPSHRKLVKRLIASAKKASPVTDGAGKDASTVHRYVHFDVLKIPDLPPEGEVWPIGTDESERPLPGQEFIPVEGIFNACSDGVTCVIDPLRPM